MTRAILELYSGTKSMTRAFAAAGWDTFTVDDDPATQPDLCADVTTLTTEGLLALAGRSDVIWASPPCTCFSVASIGTHWSLAGGTYRPKTDRAREAVELIAHTLNLIDGLAPAYWFIENPRAILRKLSVVGNLPRHTVTYCQYGDTRMKPTDIWTNLPEPGFRPPCHSGDPCHDRAPRGSRLGTQGLATARERGVIPPALCAFVEQRCSEALTVGVVPEAVGQMSLCGFLERGPGSPGPT